MFFPVGPSINAAAIIAGSLLGVLIGSKLPENVRKTVFHGIGLSTMIVGLQMALKTEQAIILIFSMIIGAVIGEILQIEESINRFGEFLKTKIKSKNPKFTDGFLTATILYCAGAMGILASFEEAIQGQISLASLKSSLDGVVAIALASAYGIGVLFSAIAVFVYQGLFVLFADFLQPYISDVLFNEATAIGGLLIVGIGFNVLEIGKIKIANLMPALLIVVILVPLFV